MRIVLSADMEGIAQLAAAEELLACCHEYWETGRQKLTDDIVAATHGLLDAGATEVVLLDNHASGNQSNVLAEQLPPAVRLATWNVFDLPDLEVDAMLQVGYHPRRGVAGFVPHTYIPGLRLWVDGEPISESHGRAWAAGVPLLGITGHANHGAALGSLAGTPFLAVQCGEDPHRATRLHVDPAAGAEAIRGFARDALRAIDDAPRPAAPADTTFTAMLDDPDEDQVGAMTAGGWSRTADDEFQLPLRTWADARDPLAAAMGAAFAPFAADLDGLDLTSASALAAQDPCRVARLTHRFLDSVAVVPDAAQPKEAQQCEV